MMRFLGLDFGWRSGPSGLACLVWENPCLSLIALDRLTGLDEILAWVDDWLPPGEMGGIAVDAPTRIANATGTRPPDRQTHQLFGKYHAGCYPANLGRPFAPRTLALAAALEARGCRHGYQIQAQRGDRYQIEVFPHPALVNLFGLDRILKYKKGPLADRRGELRRLISLLQGLGDRPPALLIPSDQWQIWEQQAIQSNGPQLKDLEDRLDALVCAYIAAHWWWWGQERNLVLGDPGDHYAGGYIIVPAPWENGGSMAQ